MRLLVVEDEPKTAGFLRKGLAEQGFAVDVARDGDAGLRRALAGEYDLIVLDVMLPGRDGWAVLAELRRAGRAVPVLVLTARDAVRDRVKGLELGADDYLVKPFAFAELLARVRALLRRAAGQLPESLRVADLELDLLHLRATRAGVRLDLTPKEFAILATLARQRGEPLSRTALAVEVWGVRPEGESNVVDVHVRRLRSKVDDPFEAKLIHTVRGVGYVLQEPA